LKILKAFYLLTLTLLTGTLCPAQESLEARSDIENEVPTNVTDVSSDKPFDQTKTASYPKEKLFIIIKKPHKVLYGNPCMEEITHNMGFEYLLIPNTDAEGYTNAHPFWHNLKMRFKLMGKNGIFYRRKLKRAIEFCREMSGDFVG
jgi:hypothetical protein